MSVRRILDIIRIVAHAEAQVTATEIAAKIGVPRATVYRLIKTLENEEVLSRSNGGSAVGLSSRFLRTMIAGAGDDQFIAGFEESLACTANTWGTTAFLGRLNGSSVEVVHAVVPYNVKEGYVHPGNNIRPAHACSGSRAILAFLPEDKVNRILSEDLTVFTDRTVTDRSALEYELAMTKSRGYAICDEEIDIGISSVAAPVIVGQAGVVCSLGIVSFSKKIQNFGIANIGEYLRAKAKGAVLNFSQNLYEQNA